MGVEVLSVRRKSVLAQTAMPAPGLEMRTKGQSTEHGPQKRAPPEMPNESGLGRSFLGRILMKIQIHFRKRTV